MMAREHARSGFVAGLGVADVAHTTIPVTIVITILVAGAALLPDLDHPSATAAHAFGPITRMIAAGLNVAGLAVWHVTATEYDRKPRDGHRTITHTIVFALFAGGLAWLTCQFGRQRGLLGTLFVLASLAVRGLLAHPSQHDELFAAPHVRRRHLFHANAGSVTLYAGALTAGAYFFVPQVDPLLVAECVALGCWVHCLGDSLTLYGCPWLWPVPIRRERWHLIGTPHVLRFRTGTSEFDGEDRARVGMNIAIVVLAIGAVPHSYTWLGHLAHSAYVAVVH